MPTLSPGCQCRQWQQSWHHDDSWLSVYFTLVSKCTGSIETAIRHIKMTLTSKILMSIINVTISASGQVTELWQHIDKQCTLKQAIRYYTCSYQLKSYQLKLKPLYMYTSQVKVSHIIIQMTYKLVQIYSVCVRIMSQSLVYFHTHIESIFHQIYLWHIFISCNMISVVHPPQSPLTHYHSLLRVIRLVINILQASPECNIGPWIWSRTNSSGQKAIDTLRKPHTWLLNVHGTFWNKKYMNS